MIEVAVSAALAVLGWAGLRVVGKVDKIHSKVGDINGRLIRVETKLDNGITFKRIMGAMRRDPLARTRYDDARS